MAETENTLREILFDLEAASDSGPPQELIRSAAKKVRDLLLPPADDEPDARPHP
jgi:hypothetical protein